MNVMWEEHKKQKPCNVRIEIFLRDKDYIIFAWHASVNEMCTSKEGLYTRYARNKGGS